MKKYSKLINNELVIKTANEIQIQFNGFILKNPSEGNILDDGWSLYSQEQEDIDLEIAAKKELIIQKIYDYDLSSNVNVFYKNNIAMWLDKTTRVSLKLRFELELKNGKNNTVLWYNGTPYEITIEEGLNMLEALEMYAIQCYDVTQMHINNVRHINTISDLENYNYQTGYPQVLYL